MEENSTSGILIDLLSRETGISTDQISEKIQLSSLVNDSLEMTSLVLAIEEKFGISVEGFHQGITVQDAVKFIEAQKQ